MKIFNQPTPSTVEGVVEAIRSAKRTGWGALCFHWTVEGSARSFDRLAAETVARITAARQHSGAAAWVATLDTKCVFATGSERTGFGRFETLIVLS